MKVSLKKRQSGFTIIELLIVIVVIGILAALVLNAFGNIQERARDTERRSDINGLHAQLELYYQDNGSYPTGATATPTRGEIEAAFTASGGAANLTADLLVDPNQVDINAGGDYSYTNPAVGDGSSYTLSATMETDENGDGTVDASDTFSRNSLN